MLGYANPNFAYQWSDAAGSITGATSSTYSASASGQYSLAVTNSNGCIATSSAVTVTIISPTAPSVLSTSSIGLDRARLNWSSSLNTDHYEVRMREQGGAWTIALNYLPASFNSFLKTGLSSSTTYEWQIRSACSSDSSSVSSWSSLESFTTLTPCTAPVNNLSVVSGLTACLLYTSPSPRD